MAKGLAIHKLIYRFAGLSAVAVSFSAGGPANASPPANAAAVASPPGELRPPRHRDRYGRTLDDLCPERVAGQSRCFAQRLVTQDDEASAPSYAPAANGDPNCASPRGGGSSTPPTGTMVPSDVLAAYKIPSASKANGQVVALVELPSVHAMADVNTYRRRFGIPELPACPVDAAGVPAPGGVPCFARVGEDGTTASVTSDDCPGWTGETGLDMDMVSAACPDCSIVLVEATVTSHLDKMNRIAATVVGALATSDSWGRREGSSDPAQYFDNPNTLTFASSGDDGYLGERSGYLGASFPASAPTVIAVGGTTLFNNGGTYTEEAWNDASLSTTGGSLTAGGSGCSTEFARPAWQSSSGFDFGKCKRRASVDLSAAAQFRPTSRGGGIAAYAADIGGWNSLEGTSAASPLVAALMVRLGLAGKDNHSLFYDHIDAFNDVTKGDNDSRNICSDVMCTAGPGWDGPTGLGTPNGERLALLLGPPPSTVDASTPADAASAQPPADAAAAHGAGEDAAAADDASEDDAGGDDDAEIGDAAGTRPSCKACGRTADNAGAALPSQADGCSCRAAGGPANRTGAIAAMIGLAALARGRRRRGHHGES